MVISYKFLLQATYDPQITKNFFVTTEASELPTLRFPNLFLTCVGTRIHQNIRIGIFKCLIRILFRMTLVSSKDSVKCNWPELFLPSGLSFCSRISGSPFSLESSFSGAYLSGFSFRILFLIPFLSPSNLVYINFHEMGFSFRWGRSLLR